MELFQRIKHQTTDDHYRTRKNHRDHQCEDNTDCNHMGPEIASAFLGFIHGVKRSHHGNHPLGRGEKCKKETEGKKTLTGFGYNIHQGGFDVFVDVHRHDALYEVEDVFRSYHREKILQIRDHVEEEKQERKKSDGIAECHGTCPFVDVILF